MNIATRLPFLARLLGKREVAAPLPRPMRRFYQVGADDEPVEVWAVPYTLDMADRIEKTIARDAPAVCIGGYYGPTHVEFVLRPEPDTRIDAIKLQAENISRALGRYVRVAQSGTHVVVQVER